MCLITLPYDSKKEALEARRNPDISTRAIHVYKRLSPKNFSPYRNMEYESGRTYVAQMKSRYKEGKRLIVTEGLHAYVSLEAAREKARGSVCNKIVRMIIPANTAFYVGSNNDIVAERLKWMKRDSQSIKRGRRK